MITAEDHPHVGESGVLDGYVSTTGQYVLKLKDCPHGIMTAGVMVDEIRMLEGKGSSAGEGATMGRPSTYSKDVAAELCAYLSMGESLRTACAHDGMPGVSTVFRWLSAANREDWADDFREQYARAKEEAADAMAEDILDISDNGSNDWMEKHYGDSITWVTNGEALQRSRLRIDTRKFLMSKMKPKRYGEKLDLTTGGDKLNRGMSDAELNTILQRAGNLADQAGPGAQAGPDL